MASYYSARVVVSKEAEEFGFWERFSYAIFQRIVWLATFVFTRTFTRFYIRNRENLKDLPLPLLVVSNHKSYWDSMIIGTLFPFFSNRYLPVGFMAYDALYQNPLFWLFFLLTGTKPSYRGRGLSISLRYPRAMLSKNGVFLIFPYGARLPGNGLGDAPGRGAGALAKEFEGLNILPVYLNTIYQQSIWDFFFGRKTMGVHVGKAFQLTPAERSRPIEEVSRLITDRISPFN